MSFKKKGIFFKKRAFKLALYIKNYILQLLNKKEAMTDRSAVDTIKGYFYQFDYSISALLALATDTNSITIEGVEDVDIKTAKETTAVQCKYYSKTEYNHSVISEPIRLMLNHFNDVQNGKATKLNYKLWGHYKTGQDKLKLPLTLDYLKDNFLTYSKIEKTAVGPVKTKYYHHTDLGLDDTQLEEFITCLEIEVYGKDFDQQYVDILTAFQSEFSCTPFIAEYFFYNAALGLIRKLSVEALTGARSITKKDFLQRVDTSKILFDEWFIKTKGERAYFQNLRKEYFGGLNILYKERFFLIEIDSSKYLRSDVKDLIYHVIRKYALITNQPSPFCPYIYLHGLNDRELIELKSDLIEDAFIILDGHDFQGSSFNVQSLVRKPSAQFPIKLKFVNEMSKLQTILSSTGKRSEIYQFYVKDEFFSHTNDSIKHIRFQIKDLKHIKQIV